MSVWPEIKRLYENSIPIYLMWKRGKMQLPVSAPGTDVPNTTEDMSPNLYFQEIRDALHLQIGEIHDQCTKISNKTVKGYVENILKVLKEIQGIISSANESTKVLSARRVVSYWNEETISLLKNYTRLLNNSSDEAIDTKSSIEEILKDLHLVYKKELGRITETDTIEIKASIAVIKNEIDQVLNRRI